MSCQLGAEIGCEVPAVHSPGSFGQRWEVAIADAMREGRIEGLHRIQVRTRDLTRAHDPFGMRYGCLSRAYPADLIGLGVLIEPNYG